MAVTASSLHLSARQLQWAKGIVAGVKHKGLSERAAHIALETAITESALRMYANGNNSRSLQLPHDAVGWDHGSVGLFQQQVGGAVNSTANWGTTEQLMDPSISCQKFLAEMVKHNWQHGDRWAVCQAVQRSAFADGSNYRHNDGWAGQIAVALWGTKPPAPKPVSGHYPDYTVRLGDSLTIIARHYHEAAITAHSIAHANADRYPSLRTNINHINVGWRLRIR